MMDIEKVKNIKIKLADPLIFKVLFLKYLAICVSLSFSACTNGMSEIYDREKLVDKSKLNAYDYRLFQSTPAWELAKAVEDEDSYKVNKILKTNPKLANYQDPVLGTTLLMLSINRRQIKSFKVLLENNADVNLYSAEGTSALMFASGKLYRFLFFRDNRYAKLLLKYGANANDIAIGKRSLKNQVRNTPLKVASGAGNLELVKLYIKHGADIDYTDEFGGNALNESIVLEHYDVARFLLENGADYTKPMFVRPYDDIADGVYPVYILKALREDIFDLGSKQHKQKMWIVNFLKSKGLDYSKEPIEEFIMQKIQKKHPHTWQEYLLKY